MSSDISEFLIFLGVLFLVETMFSEWAQVKVGLIITPTIQIFERVKTYFILFYLEPQRVSFEIGFAILSKLSVVFSLV